MKNRAGYQKDETASTIPIRTWGIEKPGHTRAKETQKKSLLTTHYALQKNNGSRERAPHNTPTRRLPP